MCAAGSADAALLIFTLAAVTPEEMPAMLHTAFQVGSVFVRTEAPCLTEPIDGISDTLVMKDLWLLHLCDSFVPTPFISTASVSTLQLHLLLAIMFTH